MSPPRRNDDEEGRRLRQRKESRYRNESESDSGEERRAAEAERKRNSRKRRQTINILENTVPIGTPIVATNSNSRIFRVLTEDRQPLIEESPQGRRPHGTGENSNSEIGTGTSRPWDEQRENREERRTEDPSELRRRRNRDEGRVFRLTEEEAQSIRERDAETHQQHRDRLAEDEVQAIREIDAEAHQRQRNSQTPQQRATVNQRRRISTSAAVQELRRGRDPQTLPNKHYCGPMSILCSHCSAAYFRGEHPRKPDGTFNPCCKNGKVTLSLFPSFPEELKKLFLSQSPFSDNFFENIRQFNTAHSFASMECQLDRPAGRGPYVYKVHGDIRHYISPAMPSTSRKPSYGQLFFVDETVGIGQRMANPANVNCDPILMALLTRIINQHHSFAREYRMMGTVYKEEEARARQDLRPMHNVQLAFNSTTTPDPRRYNAPRVPELAIVYVGPAGELPTPSNYVLINAIGGGFKTIPVTSRILDPSIYPLFFLSEQFGWHINIPQNSNNNEQENTRKVSQKDFYCWFLSIREFFNPIHYGRRLMQQFVVGSWANTEQCRLNYIRNNQSKLRSEFFNDVTAFIADGQDGVVGSRILLPASFTSSPRYMVAQYQDAMTIVARFGKPDLFLTFTCNPKWKEIVDNLKGKQTAADRPDLVARVFRMKLDELLTDIWKKNIFGQVTAYIYTVEWQKRGLPHAHMLFTLASADKPLTPEDVDALISAELPEGTSRLKELVRTHMIHRDCGPGAICYVDNKCSKGFPKPFLETTNLDQGGYPAY